MILDLCHAYPVTMRHSLYGTVPSSDPRVNAIIYPPKQMFSRCVWNNRGNQLERWADFVQFIYSWYNCP